MRNLLAFSDLKAKDIPFTRQHVARLIKQGRFPAPIKLGVNGGAKTGHCGGVKVGH